MICIRCKREVVDAPLAYQYTVQIETTDRDAAYSAAEAKRWELTALEETDDYKLKPVVRIYW